jgi:superfamily I DNA/RNA helicase
MRREHPPTVRTPAAGDPLSHLAPDQRAAATAPPGPVLCVAPAGSGKTTTLVARIAWLVDEGADPSTICAITFNRRAAGELESRLDQALASRGLAAGAVRVRTFHALGREILLDAAQPVEPLLDRDELLREIDPAGDAAGRRALDDVLTRLKLDLGVTADDVVADPDPGPVARAFLRYEAALAARGGLDFDDLVARALRTLETDASLLDRWRRRCRTLLVDEVQDADRSQLRLALLLAAPANDIFLVGDDDQTIYGWRLADVRRVIGLAARLPGLRRIDLVTNYRCPGPVVERAVRLVSCNRERFDKEIRARPGARGRLVLAPDASDDVVRIRRIIERWPADESTRAILARTNRELIPAIAAAVDAGIAFRAPPLALPVESPTVDAVLVAAAGARNDRRPLPLRLAATIARLAATAPDRRGVAPEDEHGDPWPPGDADVAPTTAPPQRGPDPARGHAPALDSAAARSLLAWAAPYPTVDALAAAVSAHRAALARLRTDDATLTIATAHGTKGLEWDHVAVVGLDVGRFPSARSVAEAADPSRTLEEERRLAYVAWTRARRSLTLLYDPGAPSEFLLEAFSREELGLPIG